MRKTILATLLVLSAWSSARGTTTPISFGAVPTDITKLTFETDPLGNPVSIGTLAANVWSSKGVIFDSTDNVSGVYNFQTPPNALGGGNSNFSPINATFSPPVSVVGAFGFDFVLEVFDSLGNSLGVNSYTDGTAGLLGGASEFAFLGFQSTTPIASARFSRFYPTNQFFGFAIDDLVFTPEPSSLALGAFGLISLALYGWRRRSRA